MGIRKLNPWTHSSIAQNPQTEPLDPLVDSANLQTEPLDPLVDCANLQTEATNLPVEHANTQNEPTAPPDDHGNRQNEPMDPQVAASSRPRLPIHRAVLFAITLVVLSGAAVRSHRNSQNEPTTPLVVHGNRQNKAIEAPPALGKGFIPLGVGMEVAGISWLGSAPWWHGREDQVRRPASPSQFAPLSSGRASVHGGYYQRLDLSQPAHRRTPFPTFFSRIP